MANKLDEILDLRTEDAKHFGTDVPGEYIAEISNGQHYMDATTDTWQDISGLIYEDASVVSTNDQRIQFSFDKTTGTYSATKGGNSLTFTPAGVFYYDPSVPKVSARLQPAASPSVTRDGNTVKWANIYPNTDLYLRFQAKRLRKQIVIRTKPAWPDPVSMGMNPATTRIVLAFTVTSPVPIRKVSDDSIVSGLTTADLYIRNASGTVKVYLPHGQYWSSNERYPRSDVEFAAQVSGGGNTVTFGIAVPYSWAQIALYPLFIDPSVDVNPAASADDGYSSYTATTGGPTTYRATINYQSMYTGSLDIGDFKSGPDWVEYVSYVRFNLASISGTCNSASLNMYIYGANGAYQYDTTAFVMDSNFNWDSGDYTISTTEGGTVLSNYGWQQFSLPSSSVQSKFGGICPIRVNRVTFILRNGTDTYYAYDDATSIPYITVNYTSGQTLTETRAYGIILH